MPVYFLCGGLGSGKSLMAVSRIQSKLESGRPVATNINLDLAKLAPRVERPMVYRLPDFPTGDDLYALGEIEQEGDEEQNGLVVLDEAGLYLNAREWNDKGRKHALEWFLHSRKLGWDVILLTQSFGMVDKQVRESIGEYVVTMRRWDRMLMPLVGQLLRLVTFGLLSGRLPRVHTAAVMYGQGQSAMHADTWHLRGSHLFGCYETKQRFSVHYEAGVFCMLPGASLVVERRRSSAAAAGTRSVAQQPATAPRERVALKPKLPWVQRVERLPVQRRIPALRTLGVIE